jgi:hypothetical protein
MPVRIALAAAGVAVTVAACGGSSSTSTSTSSTTRAARPSPPAPIRGKLVGANHSPKVNVNWPYTVTVTDASGHPLNGTVDIEFTFAGQIVGRDTPPTHPVKNGRWHDNLKFPPQAAGEPIALQAVVHTPKGSIALVWPVTVKK